MLAKKTLFPLLCNIVLFLSTLSYCADLESLTVRDFSEGLHTKQDEALIPSGAAQDLLNVDVWSGTIKKRRGSTLQNATPLTGDQAVRFLHEYIDSANVKWLLSVSSNTLFRSNNNGVTNSVLTSGLGITSSSQFSAVNAFGNAYLTDGTTNWLILTDASVVASTIPPQGDVVEFFGERLITAVGSTLRASRFGDATDWTVNDGTDNDAVSENIRQNNGYDITALKKVGKSLFIFKNFSIDVIDLDSDGLTFVRTSLSNTIGTAHPKSVQVRENDIIWFGHDGFYSYNGAEIRRISEDITPTIQDVNQLQTGSGSITWDDSTDWGGATFSLPLSTASVLNSITQTTPESSYPAAGSGIEMCNRTTAQSFRPSYNFIMSLGSVKIKNESGNSFTATFHLKPKDASYNMPDFNTNLSTATVNITTDVGFIDYGLDFSPAVSLVAETTYFIQTVIPSGCIGRFWDTSQSPYYARGVRGTCPTGCSTFSQWTFGTSDFVFSVSNSSDTWISTVKDLGANITSFSGVAITNSNLGATQTYTIYTDTDTVIDTTNSATYIASENVIHGQTPSIASQRYLTFRNLFTRDASTQVPNTSVFSLAWNENVSDRIPLSSMFYDKDYYCAVAISSDTGNDRVMIYDRNNKWSLYSYPSYSLVRYNQSPYFGSNAAGDIIRFQVDNKYADYDGSAINAYWESKEFDTGYPGIDKTIMRYYITSEYVTNSDVIFGYGVNRGSLTNETLDLDSIASLFRGVIRPASLTFNKGVSHRFRFSDNEANQNFEIFDVTLKFRLETAP